jgi:hypothetical protein
VGVNHLTDLTDEEYRSMLFPKIDRSSFNGASSVHKRKRSPLGMPSFVDWRPKGAVTMYGVWCIYYTSDYIHVCVFFVFPVS